MSTDPRMIEKYYAKQRYISAVFAGAFFLIAVHLLTKLMN